MKKCTYCGKEYPEEAVVCTIDQEPLESDSPAPEPTPASDPEPVDENTNEAQASNTEATIEAPEGFQYLGMFDPFEVQHLLNRLEAENIRFLIDKTERISATFRTLYKTSFIEIFVRQEDYERANQIVSADWKI